jgi:hypothetical protein
VPAELGAVAFVLIIGIAIGAFGMRGDLGFAGPTVELHRTQSITAFTSVRAGLGFTSVAYGRIHRDRDIGPLMVHAGLKGCWVLTPRSERSFLFSFVDQRHDPVGMTSRSVSSFDAFAREAAVSRLYGGIHCRSAIERGLEQGRKIGNRIAALSLAVR